MAKGKSSASSATRKKHAKKAAAAHGVVEEPQIPKEKKQKGKEKGKKGKEPKKKVYIPPVKPTAVQPDPLDTLGIAQKLPPELLVVLRRLAKKDSTTKRRALEELQIDWVDKVKAGGENLTALYALVDSIPVWLHHVPTLFLHSSRRIRLLSIGLHSSLLEMSNPVSDQVFYYLHEVANAEQTESILGTWCLLANDVDRQVSVYARRSWDRYTRISLQPAPESLGSTSKKDALEIDSSSFSRIWSFIQKVILDPGGVYLSINPPQPSFVPPVPPRGKGPSRQITHVKKEEESGTRSRDEEEESELDKKARLRISAFGAAEWILNTHSQARQESKETEEFIVNLDNAAIWSALHPNRTAPFLPAEIESFGWSQPGVRKAAWTFLQTLLQTCKGALQVLSPTLSHAALRSAWIEVDANVRNAIWVPLLTFLREFPNAWELEAVPLHELEEDDEDEDSEDESHHVAQENSEKPSRVSHAYDEFLQFLELGCCGAPIQGYPTIIIVLVTIPPSILATHSQPLSTLFNSFWAAIDGRALSGLDRTSASAAFLSSILECVILMTKRLSDPQISRMLQPEPEDSNQSEKLVSDQLRRVWDELCSGKLKVEVDTAGQLLAKTLMTLSSNAPDLFTTAWSTIAHSIHSELAIPHKPLPQLVSNVLKVFRSRFPSESQPARLTAELTTEIVHVVLSRFRSILEADDRETLDSEYLSSLVKTLETFGEEVFSEPEIASHVDDTLQQHVTRLLSILPSLMLVYFKFRGNEKRSEDLWVKILATLAREDDFIGKIKPLLDAAEKGLLPEFLKPKKDELDKMIELILVDAISVGESDKLRFIERLLKKPDHFISKSCFHGLVSTVIESFSLHSQKVFYDEDVLINSFVSPLAILNIVYKQHTFDDLPVRVSIALLPDVFLFGYLLPMFRETPPPLKSSAQDLWMSWIKQAPESERADALATINQRFNDLLLDSASLSTSSQILRAARSSTLDASIIGNIFPQKKDIDILLDGIESFPVDPSLAVIDILVPLGPDEEDMSTGKFSYDKEGFSTYARVCTALLTYLSEDRQAAKDNVWALRHFLALAQFAEDLLNLPSNENPVFAIEVPKNILRDIKAKAQQIATYLLAPATDESWLSKTIALIGDQKMPPATDGVAVMLYELISGPQAKDSVRGARILHVVLQHILSSAGKQEAEQLLLLARKLEAKAPLTALAIILCVTRYAPEPQRLDRYRNELAANLTGISATKANVEGLWMLRKLVAVAPDPESDVIFLPTPRAVNVVKTCQQWVSSDEDIDEEVEGEMTSLFLHLAPILQNVSGSHWDFMFDIIENNLENCSFGESSTLPTLSRTLKLTIAIQDLTSTNKALRAVWQERQTVILTLIRDLVAVKIDSAVSSPLSEARELGISIVRDLPESLIDEETLPKMCHLVMDSSPNVQTMAYHMLCEAASKRTEFVVVEAAMDSEALLKPELPAELIALLQVNFSLEEDNPVPQNLFGNLLAWMLTFDLFTQASLKVKSGYIEHLRETELVTEQFLPRILSILGLYEGIPKVFKLDVWEVEDYYLDMYDPENSFSLPLLAAHLYYRSLLTIPSLFRSWFADCRDRQLSSTITSYTSNYFSPALIRTELGQVKDPELAADLADENLKVKVANAVNEVTASYAVDEYQLELRIRLPNDWPLHGIEIKDSNRVGVSEERWRSWVLGVQQILSFRSGSIVDGVSFWKKNVASHFEGQSECAICYSMISAMDGSLPKKPCKTCKNRFHAGCLYKWFNTSHSSSCPLCRSEIIQ
ncbi:hypothetical protein C8Q75DRAFT_762281 [Abortiporus biennis]|nr:hypothetical protein C8Q75DRAFT_762281 [Abortiporus biennis]